jgi:hypothetical protein
MPDDFQDLIDGYLRSGPALFFVIFVVFCSRISGPGRTAIVALEYLLVNTRSFASCAS